MASSVSSPFQVYLRWRPAKPSTPLIDIDISSDKPDGPVAVSVSTPAGRTWTSTTTITGTFSPEACNDDVFATVVEPTLDAVMQGGTCSFMAYGHSGSGKTHTMLGHNYEDGGELGLSLATAQRLFRAINELRTTPTTDTVTPANGERLAVAVRLYELRGKHVYDLLNNSMQCHVRAGPDGNMHVRGRTELLDDGRVKVHPIVATAYQSFDELRQGIVAGLALRKAGNSSVHDQSSRTHAVLELEIVNEALTDARAALVEREADLVPVGKWATDVYIEEYKKALIQSEDGKVVTNPDYQVNQERIDAAEAKKRQFEDRVDAAQLAVEACYSNTTFSCLGGKFVFVDLAGAEYFDRGNGLTPESSKQTQQERQEGRQINLDLFALKEVLRARAADKAHVPYRSAFLTMILRAHLEGTKRGHSAMIVTASPVEDQLTATVNTLKYGSLVGSATTTV